MVQVAWNCGMVEWEGAGVWLGAQSSVAVTPPPPPTHTHTHTHTHRHTHTQPRGAYEEQQNKPKNNDHKMPYAAV